jgi:hypothetical protein
MSSCGPPENQSDRSGLFQAMGAALYDDVIVELNKSSERIRPETRPDCVNPRDDPSNMMYFVRRLAIAPTYFGAGPKSFQDLVIGEEAIPI